MTHFGLSGQPVFSNSMWLAIVPSMEGVQRVRVLETTQFTALIEITERLEMLSHGDAVVRRVNKRFMIAQDTPAPELIQFIEHTK